MSDPVARLNAALEGRYAIERELGEGGMATVYLADDIKHERKVALKVLKPELAAIVGAERFLAEIKTTANLTHPHILPLHDSGEADSYVFYVMPYVEGETLRDRINREKQLPVDEAVRIATGVANALDHAHRHGVIHRDIKPANILLQDGEPVVADFGIALAVGAAGGTRLTETGLSLGTPHYMSPEQATGDQTVGPAADTYALGSVLYEMLVGEPPYPGTTAQAVLGKIIAGKRVSATEQRPSIPANVDAAVRKALERLPADRFASAQDFAKALGDEHFRYGELATAGASAAVGLWNRLTMAFAALAAVTTLGFGWSLLRPDTPPPVVRFELNVPDDLELYGGSTFHWSTSLTISPDGSRVVFVGRSAGGRHQLWLRPLDQLIAVPISGTENGRDQRFSPDGESIAFTGGGSLRTVSLSGARPRLTVVSDEVTSLGLAWGQDGMLYFIKPDGAMWRVSENGGEPEPVPGFEEEEVSVLWPDALPNGKGVLFTRDIGTPAQDEIAVVSLETGQITTLVQGAMARYARSGHVVYTLGDGALFAAPFDMDRLEVTGPSRTLLEGIQVTTQSASYFELSETGVLVYRPQYGFGGAVPTWLDRDGSEEVVDLTLAGAFRAPRVSPDGRKLALENTPEAGAESQVWIYDLDQETFSPLTFEGSNTTPFWSPDGSEVGFLSDRDGGRAVYSRAWDRSGEARLLRAGSGVTIYGPRWTPNAQWLVYEAHEAGSANGDLFYAAPHPDSAAVLILDTPFHESYPSVSPDGHWLAYQSNESGRAEVYVRPFPGSGAVSPVSVDGGSQPIWAHNGGEIVYQSLDNSWVVATVRTDPAFAVESRAPFGALTEVRMGGSTRNFDISPDGQRLLGLVEEVVGPAVRDVVILNFFEVLEERVGN